MGRDRNYGQRHRADRVPLAAHGMDVWRGRSGEDDARRFPGAGSEGTPRRAERSRRAAPVPRLESLGFLYRPHPLRRRRLYRGMTPMAQRIAIVGGGLMGHGVAQVFACKGHPVRIVDPDPEARKQILPRIAANLDELDADRAALAQIEVVETLAACVAHADWVIEAAPEKLELKQQIFAEIEQAAPSGAIIASNTSVIPIGKIMARVERKERALGTHWWNPPFLVPLVEVVRTEATSDAAVAATMALLKTVGKAPVEVKKDVPGFVGNRLQHALWREAIALVADGVCDAETVDKVVKSSFGARL